MSRRAPPAIEGMHSLKVDNISYNTTQADLRRLFDKYGDIGDIHIPRDKYSRQSRGFAFVRFYNRRDAEYAQERTDGKWMDSRELRVSIARYERVIDDRDSGRGRGRSRSPRRRSRSRSPRYSRSRSPKRSRSRSGGRSRSPRGRDRSTTPKKSRSPTPDSKKSRSVSKSPQKRRSASFTKGSRSPSPYGSSRD